MKIRLQTLLSLALLAVILVPAVSIIITGVTVNSTQALLLAEEEVSTLGLAQAGGLNVLLDDCVSMLQSTARFDEIKQTAGGFYNGVRGDVARLFANCKAENPYLLDIIVTNENGVKYIDFLENAGALFTGFEEASGVGRTEIYMSGVTIDDADYNGANTFFILTCVNNGEDDVIGYIAMVFSVKIFIDYMEECGFFDVLDGAEMFITDRKGNALRFSGNEVTRTGGLSAPISTIVSGSLGSAPGSAGYTLISSSSHVGAYGNITSGVGNVAGGWHWYAVYPSSKVDTMPVILLIMISVAVALTLVSLVTILIIRQKTVAPLKDFVKKMRSINSGDMHERFETSGSETSEYAYMAETFNEMLNEVLMGSELYRAISVLSDNMLFEWDFSKDTMYVSDNFLEMFDIDPAKATLLNGRFMDSIMDKDEAERFKLDINKMLKTHQLNGEYQITTKTGSLIWIAIRAHCITDRLNEPQRVVGIITNINTEKLISLQLAEKASYDFLSGLYNRSTFMRELQMEIERHVNSRVGVIFIDVDDFKMINDVYGHSTGDEIIKHVANAIKEKLGTNGFGGRFGGDEFVMCVTDPHTLENIGELATELIKIFEIGYFHEAENITLKIKGSFGIAIAPEHGREAELVLAAADEAMYYVKKNGKNNYYIYNPEDSVLSELMNNM